MKSSSTGGDSSSDSLPPGIDHCELCGNRLEIEDPRNWKQVVGWVGGPKQDSMRLRENTGKFAHDECVAKMQAGQAADQPSIFEEVTDHEPDKSADLPELFRG